MSSPATFWPEALPWARQASAATGVHVSVVLSQWAIETGYGGTDWYPNNNPGNVGSFDGQPVNTFPTLAEGVQAYIDTMKLGYYAAVRANPTWYGQCIALGQSPWASAHYALTGQGPGSELVWVVENYNLTQFDSGPAPMPPPAPKPPPPPTPKEYKIMDSVALPDGTVVSHAVTPAGHYLEITRKAGFEGQPATEGLSIIDITAQYPQFSVQP
jgi:hypothetical protein